MEFQGRNVVIAGGTGILGMAVTEWLLDRGAVCHVTSFSTSPEPSFTLAGRERVKVFGGCDLGDEGTVERLYAEVGEVWASIHVAGGFAMGPLETTTGAAFDKMITMNLRTSFLCTREAAKRMPAGGNRSSASM